MSQVDRKCSKCKTAMLVNNDKMLYIRIDVKR